MLDANCVFRAKLISRAINFVPEMDYIPTNTVFSVFWFGLRNH